MTTARMPLVRRRRRPRRRRPSPRLRRLWRRRSPGRRLPRGARRSRLTATGWSARTMPRCSSRSRPKPSSGRPTTRGQGPDLGGRGQPVRPARRSSGSLVHADGPAQGRARGRRPRRGPPRHRPARRALVLRPRPDLRPRHPPRRPRRPAGHRGVVHAHLPASMALTLAGEVPDPAGLPETALFLPRLPFLALGRPAASELATRIAAALTEPPEPWPGRSSSSATARSPSAPTSTRPSTASSSSRSSAEHGGTRC